MMRGRGERFCTLLHELANYIFLCRLADSFGDGADGVAAAVYAGGFDCLVGDCFFTSVYWAGALSGGGGEAAGAGAGDEALGTC